MRVLLLHGPGEAGSRRKLIQIKASFSPDNILTFDSGVNERDLNDNLSQIALFEQPRLVILEDPPETLSIKENRALSEVTLLVWSSKELSKSKSLFKSLVNLKVEIYFFPELKEISVFPFLNSLAEGKKEAFLEAKKLTDGGFEFHYLATMVFYLLRTLVVTPKNAPPFVQKKLISQRQNFPLTKLTSLYRDLLILNFKVNSGEIETSQANFVMINKFLTPNSG